MSNSNDLPKIVEGQLSKYTNVIQGWQYRWFILKPDKGILEYYMGEEFKKHRPRGRIHLGGANISPSVEDSHTFAVNAQSGDTFKLRASDAKERQHWVNRLRTVAEQHGATLSKLQVNSSQQQSDKHSPLSRGSSPLRQLSESGPATNNTSSRAQQRVMCNSRSLYDAFSAAQEMLLKVEQNHLSLAKAIEDLPSSGAEVNCSDHELLLMKATSQATAISLKQCLGMLQHQQQAASFHLTGVTGGTTTELLEPTSSFYIWNKVAEPQVPSPRVNAETMQETPVLPVQESVIAVNSGEELTDEDEFTDSDSIPMDEQKSVVLQLLAQLKLGMDLSHVVLPTFMLEPRSLLEMFADFLGHPDMFLRATEESTAELRMLAILEWYLCTFYAGRPVTNGKKPYNPILGEVFLCSWHVPRNCNRMDPSVTEEHVGENDGKNHTKVKFVAEQVSHHPPVTAFYVECPEKKMHLNVHIWTKSMFMGMAIGVNMVGEAVLRLDEHDEEYVITFPSANARSILSVPWMELSGKVGICCLKTGLAASVTFHTKPFYGGKVHRVTAEVKNSVGSVLCKVQGEWNKVLEFSYADGKSQLLDVTNIPKLKKRLRPLSKQCDHESRAVWQKVTAALHEGDTATASQFKQIIEARQRVQLQDSNKNGTQHSAHFFEPSGDGWQYKQLKSSS